MAVSRSADIVVGLEWGDEGKGVTTDRLVCEHRAERVVRFNGGHQAAHNVVVGGRHHTFSSYGSGTLSNVPTYVSGDCVVNPVSVAREWGALKSLGVERGVRRIRVHENALIGHDYHVIVNQERERRRGDKRHGSVGVGFGEAVAWDYYGHRALRARDLRDPDTAFELLRAYVNALMDEGLIPESLGDNVHVSTAFGHMMRAAPMLDVIDDSHFMEDLSQGHTVFEGAQGFMLDENFGEAPWTTWSTTTPSNARRICRALDIDPDVYGVLRTYATRHGAGPFPGECEISVPLPEPHNAASEFQGSFRTGLHDMNLLRWSIDMVRPDHLSITHADRFDKFQTMDGKVDFDVLGVNIALVGHGADRSDVEWR